ncbi:hypothetical protein [Rothia halotolerans]|uniref:hypothetical protein n=1 Tax=Rothia halotolerans TaxID=405770 RepID=UPI00101C0102|nr:hypothetical protein [Rothia halotolerans]
MATGEDPGGGPGLPEERPRFGQRLPHGSDAPGPDPRRGPPQPARPEPGAPPRAMRRMVAGISFAMCMLGVLVISGLMALGLPFWSLVGALPLLAGLGGLIAVHWRLAPSLRDAEGPRVPRTANRLFLVPAGIAMLGVGALVVSYFGPGLVSSDEQGAVRTHVVLWVEIGLVLLLLAALIAGLIALALWTVPDEDDSILRRPDFADDPPRRRRDQRRGGEDHYDSDWFRGGA